MRKLLLLGLVVATAAVAYALAGERLDFEGMKAWLGADQSLPSLRSPEQLPFTYPADLWRNGIEGEVMLKIHITEAGAVDSVELTGSSGHARLDSIAVSGAKQLAYHPALEGEEPVAIWAVLPVRFQRGTVTATAEGR